MKEYMMALDQGTTSSRCILFDKMGNIRAKAQKEFAQIYPQEGWVEHNPKDIWSSQYSVMTEALTMLGEDECIAGIGITNQRETTIVWNKQTGEPVYNAIVWQCRRTAKEIDRLKEEEQGFCRIRIFPLPRLHGSSIMSKMQDRKQTPEICCLERLIHG